MERRTKLLIVILAAAVILAFGIWYLLQPILQTVPQPPSLPDKITPAPVVPGATIPGSGTTPGQGSGTPLSQGLKQLGDAAGIFVARLGSGANGDGFRGYDDVLINATPAYQQQLIAEQAALRKLHPVRGPAYGIVTRVVSIDHRQAVEGASVVSFIVQVQQVEDAGNPSAPTRTLYKEATVSFERQTDKTYLVSGVVWKNIER